MKLMLKLQSNMGYSIYALLFSTAVLAQSGQYVMKAPSECAAVQPELSALNQNAGDAQSFCSAFISVSPVTVTEIQTSTFTPAPSIQTSYETITPTPIMSTLTETLTESSTTYETITVHSIYSDPSLPTYLATFSSDSISSACSCISISQQTSTVTSTVFVTLATPTVTSVVEVSLPPATITSTTYSTTTIIEVSTIAIEGTPPVAESSSSSSSATASPAATQAPLDFLTNVPLGTTGKPQFFLYTEPTKCVQPRNIMGTKWVYVGHDCVTQLWLDDGHIVTPEGDVMYGMDKGDGDGYQLLMAPLPSIIDRAVRGQLFIPTCTVDAQGQLHCVAGDKVLFAQSDRSLSLVREGAIRASYSLLNVTLVPPTLPSPAEESATASVIGSPQAQPTQLQRIALFSALGCVLAGESVSYWRDCKTSYSFENGRIGNSTEGTVWYVDGEKNWAGVSGQIKKGRLGDIQARADAGNAFILDCTLDRDKISCRAGARSIFAYSGGIVMGEVNEYPAWSQVSFLRAVPINPDGSGLYRPLNPAPPNIIRFNDLQDGTDISTLETYHGLRFNTGSSKLQGPSTILAAEGLPRMRIEPGKASSGMDYDSFNLQFIEVGLGSGADSPEITGTIAMFCINGVGRSVRAFVDLQATAGTVTVDIAGKFGSTEFRACEVVSQTSVEWWISSIVLG